MFKKIQYFLFDFDGTLIDSSPLHDWAFRCALAQELPVALTHFNYDEVKGLSTKRVFEQLGIQSASQLAYCIELKQKFYRQALAEGKLVILPGARQLLECLASFKKQCCLVTSGGRESVNMALSTAGLSQFFKYILTADDVHQTKPFSEPYLKALSICASKPEEAIAIEDSEAGIESARAAGLSVIGVNNPEILSSVDAYFADLSRLQEAFMQSVKGANL